MFGKDFDRALVWFINVVAVISFLFGAFLFWLAPILWGWLRPIIHAWTA